MNGDKTGMRILIVNKFLHLNGGAETYIFKLGECLQKQGHEVQYFGMEHPKRCVGNRINAYTSLVDFHGRNKLQNLTYVQRVIYSTEARRKIRAVLDDFEPDVVHLNNFNYQLTPSIILEIVKWRRESKHDCKIVFTAHDGQLVCPNHLMQDLRTHGPCEKCLGGHFANCIKGRCIHGSAARSAVGAAEAYFWKAKGVYRHIDAIICGSEFMKRKLDTNPLFANKTVVMRNFADKMLTKAERKRDYVLYFGRFSEEKGVETLAEVCRQLPDIWFIFAGTGPLEKKVSGLTNAKNVGFKTGEELARLIMEARFSICPSECYENCPLSVMESQLYGTPVLGANIGGIPELMKDGETGELFEYRNKEQLRDKIQKLWTNRALTERYAENCRHVRFDTAEEYCEKLMKIYQ